MINITSRAHVPITVEIEEYVDNPVFNAIATHMETEYKALVSLEYSGESLLLGWNMRFYKGGRTLLRLYPRRGYCIVLVVVGRKEKQRVEALLPLMSEAMQTLYQNTQEGMGQRWLLIELAKEDALYMDVMRIVAIRRSSK